MNARKLRILLFIVMALVVAGSISGFLFVQRNIQSYANSISALNAQAQSGGKDIQTLHKLEERLNSDSDTVADARALVADDSSYIDKTIQDITRIARESGVSINGFEFIESDSTVATGGTAATPAPQSNGTPTTPVPIAAAPAGTTKKTVSVSINSDVGYSNYLTFLSKLQANELKFIIPPVNLTKGEGNTVTTDEILTIGFYVRTGAVL